MYKEIKIKKYSDETDGENHINVDINGRTVLGTLLTLRSNIDFNHPKLGQFNSMMNFWHYIQMEKPEDFIRYLKPDTVLDKVKPYKKIKLSNFKEIIANATYHKIIQNKELRELVLNNELPYAQYYMQNINGQKFPIQTRGEKWSVFMYEKLQRIIQLKRDEPDMGFFETGIDELGYKDYPEIDFSDIINNINSDI